MTTFRCVDGIFAGLEFEEPVTFIFGDVYAITLNQVKVTYFHAGVEHKTVLLTVKQTDDKKIAALAKPPAHMSFPMKVALIS
mgnify:CR=1 FL=1